MGTQKVEKQQQFHGVPHQIFMKDNYFRRWYPKWINNSMENYPIIKNDFKNKNCCISAHARPMNRPAMILGAGPSLNEAAPLLKDWKHPIFSATSSIFTPVRWGREPEYAVAFDSLYSLYDHLDLKNTTWKNTTLITHPNAEPKMIKAWRWNKLYFRRMFPGHEFFEFTFPMMFPWIRVGFRFTGCVVNNALSIAAFLGFNPIFLAGVDFGWRDDKDSKATTWEKTKNGWIKGPKTPVDPNRIKEKIKYYDGFYTMKEYFSFKEGFLRIYLSEPDIDIVDCSGGMLTEFTKDSIEEIVRTQGYKNYNIDKKEIAEKVQLYFNSLKERKDL